MAIRVTTAKTNLLSISRALKDSSSLRGNPITTKFYRIWKQLSVANVALLIVMWTSSVYYFKLIMSLGGWI